MKKFLLLSVVLGVSVPVWAQVNNNQVQWGVDNSFAAGAPTVISNMPTVVNDTAKTQDNLMPDGQPIFDINPYEDAQPILEQVQLENINISDKTMPMAQPTSTVRPMPAVQSTPTVQSMQGGGLFPELEKAQPQQKKQGSDAIKLIIDKVKIIQPALNGHAFCVGTLTMENNLNIRVQKMDLTLNYGGLDIPVNYANVSSLGGTQTQNIAWVGEFCNSMLSIPKIMVKSCIVGTLTREQCQSKIEYKPIENK